MKNGFAKLLSLSLRVARINEQIMRRCLAILLTSLLLVGCSDNVSKLFENDPPPGVKIIFGESLIIANSKAGFASDDAALQVTLVVDDGIEHVMSVTSEEAWIDWKTLDISPGEHDYEVTIFFPGGNGVEPLLIALGEQRTTFVAVDFTESMLHVIPYDMDGSGGELSVTEQLFLDADEDGMANLAEIVVGGNPYNPRPTFISINKFEFAERQNLGADYVFDYIPEAVSPRLNIDGKPAPVSYVILNILSPLGIPDAPFFIDNISGKLALSAADITKPWPVFVPGVPDNNTYIITFEADDGTRTSSFDLTIMVTDLLNLNVTISVKTLNFSWDAVSDTSGNPAYYTLLENPDGSSGFVEVPAGGRIDATNYSLDIAVHDFNQSNAQYRLEAYSTQNDAQIRVSESFAINDSITKAIGYVKSNDTLAGDEFGFGVNISADGSTLVVGAPEKNTFTGTVYLYARPIDADTSRPVGPWTFVKTLTAPNGGVYNWFGNSVSLNGDGGILAVGAYSERNAASSSIDLNTQCNESSAVVPSCVEESGAVYVFVRPVGGWAS